MILALLAKVISWPMHRHVLSFGLSSTVFLVAESNQALHSSLFANQAFAVLNLRTIHEARLQARIAHAWYEQQPKAVQPCTLML